MDTHREEFDENTGNALICEESAEARNAITATLEGLGYKVDTAADPSDTLEKLKFNQYNIIILNEAFGGSSESNTVYRHLQFMPMATRRHLFFALIGQGFKTQDNMSAFAKSANVVINIKDLPNLKTILKRSIADNEHFYKVYKESLEKMGKM